MHSLRRYDIDWLRVIAIWLLLLYHIAIGFQPWGVLIGFVQNGESIDGLKPFMSMLNVWRIPILFYISGMGVRFAIQKRNSMELIKERSQRILVPFIFGMLAIVPLHIWLWQKYYHQDMEYTPQPGPSLVSWKYICLCYNVFAIGYLLKKSFQWSSQSGD